MFQGHSEIISGWDSTSDSRQFGVGYYDPNALTYQVIFMIGIRISSGHYNGYKNPPKFCISRFFVKSKNNM